MKPIMLKTLLPEYVSLNEEDIDPEVEKAADDLKKMLDAEINQMKVGITAGMKDAEKKLQGKSEDDAERMTKTVSPGLGRIIETYKIAKLKESTGKMTEQEVNELIDPFTAASIALALPKIIEWIGKIAKKIAQKMGKTGKSGEVIEAFAHKFHDAYIKLIRKILDITLFMIPKLKGIDEQKKKKITEIFFYTIVATIGFEVGGTAIEALENSDLFHGTFEGLMAAVKGGEVTIWIGKTIGPIIQTATA